MKEDYRRHDISDRAWNLLEPHLPGRPGTWGRVAKDNRKFRSCLHNVVKPESSGISTNL